MDHMKRHFLSYFLVFTCTLVTLACTCCNKSNKSNSLPLREGAGVGSPVQVRASLFHNPDSLLLAFLRENNPDFPDSCTTVPLDEARIMLLRAAELGNEDAKNLIHCLELDADWELQY